MVTHRLCGSFNLKLINLAIMDDADMIATSHNFVSHLLDQLPNECQKVASSAWFNQNSISNLKMAKMDFEKIELSHIENYYINCSDPYQKCGYIRPILQLLQGTDFKTIIFCNVRILFELILLIMILMQILFVFFFIRKNVLPH